MLRRSLPFLLVPVSLLAQGVDIRGSVSDSSNGEKIPFASVAILGTNRGASSSINGFYLIPNVPAGRYQIAASSIGYERQVVWIDVGGREPIGLNFKLTPKPVEFSEIVVTDKAKRELTEIQTSVHVLEQRDIKRVPMVAQEDIFKAIQILPGVVSTSDVSSNFYVRGGAGDQNLILLDGMKIYNPYHAFGIFSIFDSDVIKTTEVYTGAFPPGFGGRLSSVVNLITRDGKSTAIAGRANMNFVSSKLQLEGPLLSDMRWMVSGRKSLFNQTFSRFLKRDVPLSFYDALVKLTRESEDAHSKYGFQGFYSGDDMRSASLSEPNYMWRNHAVGFTAGGLVQDRVFVDAVAFENFFEAKRDAKGSTSITDASTTVKEVGIKANATLYTGSRDLFFFGFEFSFPTLEYNLTNTSGNPVRLFSSLVESWMWLRYQTTMDRLQFDGGFHVDVGSLFSRTSGFEIFQPRLNMSYLLWEGWRGKVSYGRFNQNVITVNNEDDVISIFDAWIMVPERLKSEQADHYVVGLEGNLAPSLSTSVQTYYKQYNSLVTYNRDKVDAIDPDYINSSGKAFGVETLVRFGTPLVDCYSAYTISWTNLNVRGFTYPPRYDRRHSLNILAIFHVVEALDVTLRWEFGSGFPFSQTIGFYDRLKMTDIFRNPTVDETGAPYSRLGEKNAARLPAYHRLDASVNYMFSFAGLKGSVGCHIVNVYDQMNIFYFDRKTGQQINMLPFFPSLTLNIEY